MTVRPIDMQVVVGQQSNVAGQEQAQQNVAAQVKAQDLQKIPDKTHEREMQVQNPGEPNQIKVKEKEAEKRKQGGGKNKAGNQEEEEEQKEKRVNEEGKGVQFDVTT